MSDTSAKLLIKFSDEFEYDFNQSSDTFRFIITSIIILEYLYGKEFKLVVPSSINEIMRFIKTHKQHSNKSDINIFLIDPNLILLQNLFQCFNQNNLKWYIVVKYKDEYFNSIIEDRRIKFIQDNEISKFNVLDNKILICYNLPIKETIILNPNTFVIFSKTIIQNNIFSITNKEILYANFMD